MIERLLIGMLRVTSIMSLGMSAIPKLSSDPSDLAWVHQFEAHVVRPNPGEGAVRHLTSKWQHSRSRGNGPARTRE